MASTNQQREQLLNVKSCTTTPVPTRTQTDANSTAFGRRGSWTALRPCALKAAGARAARVPLLANSGAHGGARLALQPFPCRDNGACQSTPAGPSGSSGTLRTDIRDNKRKPSRAEPRSCTHRRLGERRTTYPLQSPCRSPNCSIKNPHGGLLLLSDNKKSPNYKKTQTKS